jgi:hypothetical protein
LAVRNVNIARRSSVTSKLWPESIDEVGSIYVAP